MKKSHKIISIIIIVFIIMLGAYIAIISNAKNEKEFLKGKEFGYYSVEPNKYRLPSNHYAYKKGTILPVTNYQEFKKLSKEYKFNNLSTVTKEDLKENDYLYIVIGETGCFDSAKLEYYIINNNEIDIYFSENNCECSLSRIDNYVYEIKLFEKLAKNMTYNIHFIEDKTTSKTCDLSK